MYEQNQQSGSQAQPPPYTPSPQPAQPNTPNNVSSKGVTYAIVAVVIVIVAGGIAFSLMGGSKSQTNHPTTLSKNTSLNSHNTTPSTNASSNPLYSMISSNKNISVNTFSQILNSKFNNTGQINISYSGLITTNLKLANSNGTERMYINAEIMKYGSNSRADINLSDIPLLGNISIVDILKNGEMYSCAKLSSNSFGFNYSNTSSSYRCQPPTPESSLINLVLPNKLSKNSIHLTSVKQSSYEGYSCILTSGYILVNTTVPANASSSVPSSIISSSILPPNSNVTFSTCISDAYYIPLTITTNEVNKVATFNEGNGTVTVTMQLNETSINNYVSPSITDLPGPIISYNATTNPSNTP